MSGELVSPDERDRLVSAARSVRAAAYAPYSHFPVGAALLGEDGVVYRGVNVESAAFPAGICAERSALAAAVSHGQRRFRGLAVATAGAGSPCGTCRQALLEFGDCPVWMCDVEGAPGDPVLLSTLLPMAFGKEVGR